MDIKHENGRTWIDGVQGFSPAVYASSPHGCQARILEAVGDRQTYDDLVCYSGLAFRIGIHEALCPSGAHPFCGYVCIEGSNRALPWRMQLFESRPWDGPKEDQAAFEAEARAAVKDSIDRGVPVHYGGEEDGLIVGYADDGDRWWCVHPYYKRGTEAFWHDEAEGFAGGSWPWGLVVWTEPKAEDELVSDRELTVAALEQAVDMWRTEKSGDYFVGDAAYGQWFKWLRSVDAGEIADPAAGMMGNGWCYDVLVQSRRVATNWLAQRAETFDVAAASDLRAAASSYASVVDLCSEGLECTWDLVPGPDKAESWSSEMRIDQLTRLESAHAHDRAAVAAIERALAAIG